MTEAKFAATITAKDETSATLTRIGGGVERLAGSMKRLHDREQSVGFGGGVWGSLTSRIHHSNEAMEGLAGTAETLHGRLSSLLPPLAALGEIGAIGGLFKLTEEVAEASAANDHLAKTIGITAGELGKFKFLATQTDTDVGSMATGFQRLEVTVAKAGSGMDKNAAGLFKQLGISLRDSHGQLKNVTALSDDIFKAFRVNTNEDTRGLIARTLFGRGGMELIPLLTSSREQVEELGKEFERLRFKPPNAEAAKHDLEEYHQSWLKLKFEVGQVEKAIGTDLAPKLKPVVDGFTSFLSDHRAEIAEGITSSIIGMADAIKSVDWPATFKEFDGFAHDMKVALDSIGGFKTVIELFVAWKALSFGAGIIRDFGAIGGAANAARIAILGVRNLENGAREVGVEALSASRLGLPLGLLGATAAVGAVAGFEGAKTSGRDIAENAEHGRVPIMIDDYGNAIGYRETGDPLRPMSKVPADQPQPPVNERGFRDDKWDYRTKIYPLGGALNDPLSDLFAPPERVKPRSWRDWLPKSDTPGPYASQYQQNDPHKFDVQFTFNGLPDGVGVTVVPGNGAPQPTVNVTPNTGPAFHSSDRRDHG